ncbi:hypothetical protein KKC17_03335 [Patescibacteria group bacterium]|nr:hypothetical protein [Patescibacteria group bacterium]
MINLSKYLEPGEVVTATYQPILLSQGWTIFWGSLAWALALFLVWPLINQGQWGLIGLGLLIIVGSYWLLRARLLWRGTLLLLTEKRLIDINRLGLFKEVVSQVAYVNLEDVNWTKPGLAAQLLNYGTVAVSYSHGTIKLNFSHIKNPKELATKIISQQNSV